MSKKLFLVIVAGLVLASGVFSQTVIKSFVAPGDGGTWGLTWDGQSLWSANVTGNNTSVIYQLDTLGNVLSSFNWPHGFASGLAWDGTNLWLTEAFTGDIYKASKTGEELLKISTALSDVTGLAFEDSNLWVIDRGDSTVNQVSSEGNIVKSFSVSGAGSNLTGLTWDGSAFLLCNALTNKIFEMTLEGEVLQSFTGPGTNATELEWDGNYLWISDIVTDRIYQVRVPILPTMASAKIVFRPSKWNIAWRNPGQEECEKNEDEEEDDDDDVGGLVADGNEGNGKINCYIGEIKVNDSLISVKHIMVETIRLNSVVEVARKADCGDDDDIKNVLSVDSEKLPDASARSANNDQKKEEDCFFAKILRRHQGFIGKVLKVKFNKFEALNSLPEDIQVGDSVEVTVGGKLDNGIAFEGRTKIFITGCRRTGVKDQNASRFPQDFKLMGNFPNPFNATTQIKYYLSRDGQVELTVYNLLGKKVRVLVNEIQTKGEKVIFWDGKDDFGQEVASGNYFYKLVTQNETDVGKMTLLK